MHPAGEPNVMPVLDADPHHSWYVMPLAVTDANAWQSRLGDRELAAMLAAVCEALVVAHAAGYIHRDITPHNVLYLEDEDGDRWVLADWGLVRIPSGSSTTITSTGAVIGTDGFIAPEVLRGGEASEASDVFSLGRIAAWAISGEVSLAGQDVVPSGPFRRLIRAATRSAPGERSSLAEFRSTLTAISFSPPPQPTERACELREGARGGDGEAAAELLALADENPEDAELYLDFLAPLRRGEIADYVPSEPEAAGRIAAAMSRHVCEDFHGLRGQTAAAVARSLVAAPAGAEWHLEEDWTPSRQSDPQIRGAFHTAATATSH